MRNVASISLISCSLIVSACSEMRETWEWARGTTSSSPHENAPSQRPQQGRTHTSSIPPKEIQSLPQRPGTDLDKPETSKHAEVLPSPKRLPSDRSDELKPHELPSLLGPREKTSYIDKVAPVPYKEGAFESFVTKAKKETGYSWLHLFATSVPAYLPKDKGTKKLGRFERDDQGRPLANFFALNFYRQPGKGHVGPFVFEILPISISGDGEALEHAKLYLHGTKGGAVHVISLPGTSWSYAVGDFYLYRWKALPNEHAVYGIEVLAPKVNQDTQSKKVEFFYDAYVYFTKGRSGDLFYKKITVTLPSQFIHKMRIF